LYAAALTPKILLPGKHNPVAGKAPILKRVPCHAFHEADYLVKTGQMVNKKIDFGRQINTLCHFVVWEVSRTSLTMTG